MSYSGHLLGGVLPLWKDAVDVFYSPSWLGLSHGKENIMKLFKIEEKIMELTHLEAVPLFFFFYLAANKLIKDAKHFFIFLVSWNIP